MRRSVVPMAALLLSTVLLAGCGSSTGASAEQTQQITMEALKFQPSTLEVQRGQHVKLTVVNKDVQLHDFSVDKIPVVDKREAGAGKHDMSNMGGMNGAEPDLHVPVDAGKTGVIEFTPTESGTYTFYCTVAGHKESGMQGTLTVK